MSILRYEAPCGYRLSEQLKEKICLQQQFAQMFFKYLKCFKCQISSLIRAHQCVKRGIQENTDQK